MISQSTGEVASYPILHTLYSPQALMVYAAAEYLAEMPVCGQLIDRLSPIAQPYVHSSCQ